MKISGRKQVGGPSSIGQSSKAKEKTKADSQSPVETGAANVNLSNTMREVDKARQTVQNMPDVRVEKVNELKPIVDDGSYHVESKVLAKRMVDSSLRESAQLGSSRKK